MRKKGKSRYSLTFLFAGLTFGILLVSMTVAGVLLFGLTYLDFYPAKVESIPDILLTILFMTLISMIVGSGIAMLAVRIPLGPINWMITQMNKLAAGDFSARVHFEKPVSLIPAFREMEKSFNTMAQELGNTEMLRSDFINNFSHELKTPIVSITGFAKLLQRGKLSPEQQTEYISAIAEESVRLSRMATNVLNLTKVENQSILTNLSEFNLSEQLRSAVLLLETSWTEKHLELDMDFPEINITANEELLKEVWINLLQNAVKFSPDFGPLQIQIQEQPRSITVTIANSGDIAPEDLPRIWNKFYQADRSHSGAGNGVGLSIVKRIVELHRGNVAAKSEGGAVIFTVTLPK